MINTHQISLINKFPNFAAAGFNIDTYNRHFKQSNVIINASATDISYAEHWGCLSIKCAFGGDEIYRMADRQYAVNDKAYFICNDGEYYSSYIAAKQAVESFTLNFSQDFVKTVSQGLLSPARQLLDEPDFFKPGNPEFIQKLYRHNTEVSGHIFALRDMVKNFTANKGAITEQYYLLLEKLFVSQCHTGKEIAKIKAAKLSTQKELYKRLHYAKDFIDSCYMQDIKLDQLARIACLNSAYLLREFKKYFEQTPYQYLVKRRMEAASELLLNTRLPVTEICYSTGYADASSFCKLFKKYYQSPPERYRVLHGKKVIFHT